jgi:hypothetical protein
MNLGRLAINGGMMTQSARQGQGSASFDGTGVYFEERFARLRR